MSKTILFTASWRVSKASFITLIRKQNEKACNGIIQHRLRKKSRNQHHENFLPGSRKKHTGRDLSTGEASVLFVAFRCSTSSIARARQTSRDEKDTRKRQRTFQKSRLCVHSSQKNLATSPHPPYSLDLALSDYKSFGFVQDQIRCQHCIANETDLGSLP
jgi:hypothetical protein